MIPLSVLLQGQVLVVLSLCLLHFPVCLMSVVALLICLANLVINRIEATTRTLKKKN